MKGMKDWRNVLPWAPAADVYRTQDGWVVKLELAGVRPDELEIRFDGRFLTVAGTRRDWCVQESQGLHSMEISYSSFQRTVELPCELAGAGLATEYREGMLLVRLTCGGER